VWRPGKASLVVEQEGQGPGNGYMVGGQAGSWPVVQNWCMATPLRRALHCSSIEQCPAATAPPQARAHLHSPLPTPVVLPALQPLHTTRSTSYVELASGQGECPEPTAGLVSRLGFNWISPLMKLGNTRPLQQEDVWLLPPGDRVQVCGCPAAVLWGSWGSSPGGCLAGVCAVVSPDWQLLPQACSGSWQHQLRPRLHYSCPAMPASILPLTHRQTGVGAHLRSCACAHLHAGCCRSCSLCRP
jgi:hypothetical protein